MKLDLNEVELHNFAGCEPAAEFRGIALNRFPEKKPERPVVGIQIYPCNLDRLTDPDADPFYRPYLEMKKIFRETMEEFSVRANVHMVEGEELMDNPCGIYCDSLHLSTCGQVLMGINLAERMRPLLFNLK